MIRDCAYDRYLFVDFLGIHINLSEPASYVIVALGSFIKSQSTTMQSNSYTIVLVSNTTIDRCYLTLSLMIYIEKIYSS